MIQTQDENPDLDDSVDMHKGDVDLKAEITVLNQKIQSFPSLYTPPLYSLPILSQTAPFQIETQVQPSTNKITVGQCKQCGHPYKGNKHPKSGPTKCNLCSGAICSPNILHHYWITTVDIMFCS